MSIYRIVVATAVIVGLLMSLPVSAKRYKQGRWVKVGNSLDQAVSEARKRTGGRVLSAETREINGRRTHVIRVLTDDGRVIRLLSDGDGGRDRAAPRRR